MKQADYYEPKTKPSFWKRFRLPFLIAMPVIGILLVAIPLSQRLWTGSFGEQGLNPLYIYRFQRSSPGTIMLGLEREIAFYQKRISQDSEDYLNRAFLATAYLKMARASGETSWYLLAEQTAQESLAKFSFHNDGAIMALARVATARHDFTDAIRLAKQLNGKDKALPILVTANLAIGNVAEANRAADALVAQNPDLAALTLRALVRLARGKDQEAIQDFQQALAAEEPEETGSSIWARTLLGRLYYKRGQLKLARELYQEALRVLPQYPPALLNMAELEIRLGNYEAAESLYSQFFQLSRQSPTIYDHIVLRGMARLKDLQGDQAGARQWRDRAEARLRQDLTSFGHRRELARLLLERGGVKDVAEALSLMQAEVHNRRDAETFDTLAWALSLSGNWREAQQSMHEALRWGIRDPAMFERAGRIEQALGNRSQAIAFFKSAKETDPSFNEQAQRALGLGVGLLGLN